MKKKPRSRPGTEPPRPKTRRPLPPASSAPSSPPQSAAGDNPLVAKVGRYLFLALLLILLYLTFRLFLPFLAYLVLALILTIAAYPLYSWLVRKLKRKAVSGVLTVIVIILVIIIPSFFIIRSLVSQSSGILQEFQSQSLAKTDAFLRKVLGPYVDVASLLDKLLAQAQDFLVNSAIAFVGSLADFILGLFILFFGLYYAFTNGDAWVKGFRDFLPLSPPRKEKLLGDIRSVSLAVIYVQILGSLLQGLMGGLGFFLAGIEGAVFWGFLMTVLALLPVVGPALVWVPAGVLLILNGAYFRGGLVLVWCFTASFLIDNVLRPRIVSVRANIHPLVALVGVLGGLKVFGFLGILIGPLVAALFITMAGFFYEDYLRKSVPSP